MAILQVTTSNTFSQWLVATQALIDKYNFYEDTTNLVFDKANTVSNISNFISNTSNSVNVTVDNLYNYVSFAYNAANTIYDIANAAYDTANMAYEYSNSAYEVANAATSSIVVIAAFNTANAAYNKANGAFDQANAAFDQANGAALKANTTYVVDTANNIDYYVTFLGSNTTTTNIIFRVTSTKLTYNPSTGTLNSVDFNSTSDMRLKENFDSISALDIVNRITPYSFNWKETGKKSYGIIAQEIEEILPELVNEREDGYKGISYIPLISILIQAVKDLNIRINELENTK